ncbi:MAG: AraC family transcriptional regulator [Bradyrhizobium sp.]
MTSRIPSTHVDTQRHPVPDQFDQWCQAVVGFDVSRPAAEAGAPFSAKVDAWSLGEIVVIVGDIGSSHSYFAKDRLAQPKNYSFLLVVEGVVELTFESRSLTVNSGQIVAIDWRQPAKADMMPARTVQVVVAGRMLQAEMGEVPVLHGALIGSAAGRILTEYLLSLARELPSADLADVQTLSNVTVKMITACLSGLPIEQYPSDPVLGTAIRQRVGRYIEERIGARDLTVAMIARDLAISRATLYRAFSSSAGVAGYLQTRRLEAAHAALSDKNDSRTIKAIAVAFGFSSASHFNNAFLRRFSYRPSEARIGPSSRIIASEIKPDATPEARLRAIVASLSRSH